MSEQPEGIEHGLDSAIADSHHTEPAETVDVDTVAEDQRDPDDPETAIRESTDRSHGN